MQPLPPINGSEFKNSDGQPAVTYAEAQIITESAVKKFEVGKDQTLIAYFDPDTHAVSIGERSGVMIIQPRKARAASG